MPNLGEAVDWSRVPVGEYRMSYGTTFTTDIVWTTWVNGTGSNSITTSDTVWTDWNTTAGRVTYQPYVYTAPKLTPEQIEAQRAERERIQAEWRAAEEKRVAEEAEARRRARIILEENLTPEQHAQFKDNGWFEVVTPRGTYRIRNGRSGNVDRYVDGGLKDRFCTHPTEMVPNEDNMLIQKLLLETDEEAFLRIANRSIPYA